ncbi:FmdB family transcriptional regulator [Ornithinimicrobium faecis]|uniref:FmdB family transcriptional regulator n=1 Tax=Ornithinimicrobium faecis TaxID=2934158 RepID=A0ABY4YRW9_9MICO|nr:MULTISPECIES: FmdB family zinc ribbon protein [unclassified Ornithinimicrobium]USQ79511.1 FmdB family transcriptional regulator [Ornithinimicrobium sp. HY1793]
MPTYSYACKDCDNAFDIQQAFSDDSLTVCPECGGALRKRYGSVGVVFKGSGFYRTDSRKGAVSASSGDSSGSKSSDSSSKDSSSSSSDTKSSSSSSSTPSTSTSSSSTSSSSKAASA